MKVAQPCALAVLASLILPVVAQGAEGGTGHYVPGALGTLIDLPPTQPGWVVEAAYMHYGGDASADIPVAGLDAARLDVDADAFLLGGFYTFALPLEGAFYSLGGFIPYVWMDARASIDTALGNAKRHDSHSGVGDITLIPGMFAWKSGFWQLNALLPIYAPTGDYDEGRLANPGLNYWTFDPTIGGSYNNEKIGFNAAFHVGIALNTENTDTNYKSGHQAHLEASLQQLLPVGPGFLGLGTEAFYLQQVTGDSGSGARFGNFKRRTVGIGPVLTYVLPIGENSLVAEARWLPELETKRQLEGDYLWFKLVFQF